MTEKGVARRRSWVLLGIPMAEEKTTNHGRNGNGSAMTLQNVCMSVTVL